MLGRRGVRCTFRIDSMCGVDPQGLERVASSRCVPAHCGQQAGGHWELAGGDLSSFHLRKQKGSSIYVSRVICNTCSGSLCFLTSQKSQQIVHSSKAAVSVRIYRHTHPCCLLCLASSFFLFGLLAVFCSGFLADWQQKGRNSYASPVWGLLVWRRVIACVESVLHASHFSLQAQPRAWGWWNMEQAAPSFCMCYLPSCPGCSLFFLTLFACGFRET